MLRRTAIFLFLSALLAFAGDPTPDALIEQLGATAFKDRIAAQKALIQLGAKDPDGLLKTTAAAWRKTEDPEVQIRLRIVIEQIVRDNVYARHAGYLGIMMMPRRSLYDRKTVDVIWIDSLVEGGPAEKAGLRADDEILEVEGKRFEKGLRNSVFIDFLQTKRPGYELKLTVLRDGKPKPLKATLGKAPLNVDKNPPKENFPDYFTKWWRNNVLKKVTEP